MWSDAIYYHCMCLRELFCKAFKNTLHFSVKLTYNDMLTCIAYGKIENTAENKAIIYTKVLIAFILFIQDRLSQLATLCVHVVFTE